jgi:hypothetical protein
MQRLLPRIITFVIGMFLAIQYFIPHKSSEKVYETSIDWLIIVGVFAVVLGILSWSPSTWRRSAAGARGIGMPGFSWPAWSS